MPSWLSILIASLVTAFSAYMAVVYHSEDNTFFFWVAVGFGVSNAGYATYKVYKLQKGQ